MMLFTIYSHVVGVNVALCMMMIYRWSSVPSTNQPWAWGEKLRKWGRVIPARLTHMPITVNVFANIRNVSSIQSTTPHNGSPVTCGADLTRLFLNCVKTDNASI